MKNKKIYLIIAIFLILITLIASFGRYIYNYARDYLLSTKGFYFNSFTMSVNESSHKLNNWDGVSPYTLTLDVNNKKNEYIYTETDIDYDITYECSSNVSCSVSKTEGTIISDEKTDSYTITFTPTTNFTSSDYAIIKTSVTSTNPYVKTLKTEYQVGIEVMGLSYSITDNKGEKYVTLEINNGLTYYEVIEEFNDYSLGDHISMYTYEELSDENKNKCKSAYITLSFNPNQIRIDSNDTIYINESYNVSTLTIDNYEYVNGFSFKMKANQTIKMKFYKLDSTQNYNDTNIITVSTDTAE